MKITQDKYTNSFTQFGTVRIDDLFFGVKKIENENGAYYSITVEPNSKGSAYGTVVSAGMAIGSDEAAEAFLNKLQELKDLLKLSSF